MWPVVHVGSQVTKGLSHFLLLCPTMLYPLHLTPNTLPSPTHLPTHMCTSFLFNHTYMYGKYLGTTRKFYLKNLIYIYFGCTTHMTVCLDMNFYLRYCYSGWFCLDGWLIFLEFFPRQSFLFSRMSLQSYPYVSW